MSAPTVPAKTTVLVIGGGPGGSYAACCLAREGIDTVVIEAEKFPRYHVGESMMVALRHFLRFIDLEKTFEDHGFNVKVGAAFKLNRNNREGYTDFVAMDKRNFVWNLLRSESDELLLRHAESSGAIVVEETKVTEVQFEGEGDKSRPVSATWKNKAGETGSISFDYVIDASGRTGILSTKNLKNRKYNQSLKNVACWGYWKGTGVYSPQTSRRGSPWFEALTDQSGWAWFIPLHNGVTSIGIVENQDISTKKKKEAPKGSNSTRDHYMRGLQLAPDIIELIGDGELLEEPFGHSTIQSASDYSYSATHYAGPGYRLVGDAGAFIDPFFSSGVHLAISGGLSAAATICSTIRGELSDELACQWHSAKVGTSYTRFLVVVLAAYRQMHAQNHAVLSDVDEDNFDRAFEHFRPIIQGHSDIATTKFSDDLKATIDFCAQAFEPSEPEPEVGTDPNIDTTKEIEESDLAGLDKDSKRVFSELQNRGQMNNSDFEHMDNLVSDRFHGLQLRLTRGNLGLVKV